jgi:hypothetical protein
MNCTATAKLPESKLEVAGPTGPLLSPTETSSSAGPECLASLLSSLGQSTQCLRPCPATATAPLPTASLQIVRTYLRAEHDIAVLASLPPRIWMTIPGCRYR